MVNDMTSPTLRAAASSVLRDVRREPTRLCLLLVILPFVWDMIPAALPGILLFEPEKALRPESLISIPSVVSLVWATLIRSGMVQVAIVTAFGHKASVRDFVHGLRKAPALFVSIGIPVTLLGVVLLKLQELQVRYGAWVGLLLMAVTVFFAVRFILFPPALLDGRCSFVEALRLSWRLGKGHGKLLVGLAMVFAAEGLVFGLLMVVGLRSPIVGRFVVTLLDWFLVMLQSHAYVLCVAANEETAQRRDVPKA